HPLAGGWRLLPSVVWVLIAAIGLLVSLPPEFDPNLIKLQDEELPSVQQVHKLQSWSEVVLSPDLTKLRAARAAILANAQGSTIRGTESILDAYDKRDELLRLNGDKM